MAYLDKNPRMSPCPSHPNKLVATISAAITNKNKIQIKVSNLHANALVDTGANISVVCSKFLSKITRNPTTSKSEYSFCLLYTSELPTTPYV